MVAIYARVSKRLKFGVLERYFCKALVWRAFVIRDFCNPEGLKYPEMATSSTIQINISLYMFLAQFLLKKKNIFLERFGFNFFPAKRRDIDERG